MEIAEEQTIGNAKSAAPLGIAVMAALLASILFSGKGILTKAGMTHGVTALDMLAFRMILAAPVYAFILFWSLRRQPVRIAALLPAVGLGLLGCYVCPTLNFYGLQSVSASLERILIHAIPAFVIVVAAVRGTEKIRRRTALALAICYTGVALSCLGRDHGRASADPLGITTILLGCLLYAIFLVRSAEMQKRIGTITFTSTAMLASALACLVQNMLQGNVHLLQPPAGVMPLAVALAVLCTIVPAYLSAYGIKMLGAGRSSVLNMLGPLLTPVAAALVLGERMSALQIAGFTLVFSGALVLARPRRPAKN
jgi:drug/metabolite transporter (DMT)-like permease